MKMIILKEQLKNVFLVRKKKKHYVTDVKVVGSVCMKIAVSGNLLEVICVIFFQVSSFLKMEFIFK